MAAIDEAQRQLDMSSLRISSLGDPTAANDATKTDNTTAPSNPAAAASAGASLFAAPINHVHQGLHSVKADANAQLFGDVILASGTGITLGQAGNTITVNASSNSVNKVTWGQDEQKSNTGTTEAILFEFNVNLDDAGGGAGNNISARISAFVKTSAGTGTFKMRTGATSPGSTTGSTVQATITTTNTAFEQQTNLGSAFSNPGGQVIVQITALGSAGGVKATYRGGQYSIG